MAGRETRDKQIETLRKKTYTQMQNMFVCISQKNKNYFRKLDIFVLRKKSIFFGGVLENKHVNSSHDR